MDEAKQTLYSFMHDFHFFCGVFIPRSQSRAVSLLFEDKQPQTAPIEQRGSHYVALEATVQLQQDYWHRVGVALRSRQTGLPQPAQSFEGPRAEKKRPLIQKTGRCVI